MPLTTPPCKSVESGRVAVAVGVSSPNARKETKATLHSGEETPTATATRPDSAILHGGVVEGV